jgi:hypothetical protein
MPIYGTTKLYHADGATASFPAKFVNQHVLDNTFEEPGSAAAGVQPGDVSDPVGDSTRPAASPSASGVVRARGPSQEQAQTPAGIAQQFLTKNYASCTDKWREFTCKRTGQSNMDAFCEFIGVVSMEVTADNDSGQLLDFLTHVVIHKDKFRLGVNTAVVQDFGCAADLSSVVSAAFKVLHYERGGYMKLRVRTDGRLAKNQDPVTVLDLLEIKPGGLVYLRRNGAIECPMWDMPQKPGPHDCIIVALNNAVGHGEYSREKLANIDPELKFGDMPVCRIKNAMEQDTPYTCEICYQFEDNFEAFLQTEGIYVLVAALVLKTGEQQNHAIAFDAYRNIVNFGMDDSGSPMTFYINKPDRLNVSTAKDNLLEELGQYSSDVKDIKIFHVMCMQVKVKKLKLAHDPAYTVVEGIDDMDIVEDTDDMQESTAKPALKRKARGKRGGDRSERRQRQKANKCEP